MGSNTSRSTVTLSNTPQSKGEKDSKNRKNTTISQMSSAPCDVMISYSHVDKEMMTKLRSSLEADGITVWVDVTGLKAGVDFLSKIGEAIIDSKMFVSLLSSSSITSKYCQDELALAYVSNKPIFPVITEASENLTQQMPTGMKLQLAGFEWNMFSDPASYEENLKQLSEKMKNQIGNIDSKANTSQDQASGDDTKTGGRAKVNKQASNKSAFLNKLMTLNADMNEQKMNQFWESTFGKKESVTWEEFLQGFQKDYQAVMNKIFSKSDQDWLMAIVAREMDVEESDGSVTKTNYTAFCTAGGEFQPFWVRVNDQAVESYAMKEVFDMDSSVRVQAIENLGKFRSTAVIEALLDLLSDSDNNVKAVAAISLAKTGSRRPDVSKALLKCLNCKDRLVRESGCLALGHLAVTAAVPKLVQLWRNDYISSVREASQVALEKIGGEEANKAMHMTKVLAEEIRMLTSE